MNHTYRLIWSPRFGALVPVAENAGSVSAKSAPRRRSGQGRAGPGGLARLASLARALALALGLTPVAVMALPAGGQVEHGQATIHKDGSSLTVDQASQKAIINWQRFGIGKNQSVTFHQPGASSVALNRVVGSDPSAIYGALTANGQLFLVNPNGILFAPGSAVDVGGLVASTLGISNSHFLSGNYTFSGNSTNAVINKGRIKTAQGGYVAFIGHQVDNEGAIDTPGGTTALGAGARVHLTLAGDSLLSFDVSQSALAAAAKNGGLIQAKGGQVILSAAAKNAALRTVVNNTGVVRAEGVAKHGGVIKIMGGNSGTTHVAGTLDAKSSDGGAAGTIETSGHHLKIADAKVSAGPGGQWLLDPVDLTIGTNAAAAISAALNSNTSVTEETTKTSNASSGSSNSGTTASGSNHPGNINVDAKIQWSSGAKLTLSAYHSVNVNAPIIASGSNAALAVVFDNNQGGTSSGGSFNVNKPVTLSGSGASFSLNGIAYTVIQSMAGLQAMSSNLAGDYVLGKNLTDTNSTSPGFSPVGTNSSKFTGTFDGLGHNISNLYINTNISWVGLFGSVGASGVIRNVGLVSASITGQGSVGALVGSNSGKISNAFATAHVTGSSNNVGGLVGYNTSSGTINDSYASSNVSGASYVGGLVGLNAGSIDNTYATGNVSDSSFSAGGLVGANSNTISNSYATGKVTGSSYNAGGLVGASTNGTIRNSYATGSVSDSTSGAGGLAGYIGGGSVSNAYATGPVSGSGHLGGFVGTNNGGSYSGAYWDTDTAGIGTGVGNGSSTGIKGYSTAALSSNLPSGFKSSVWGNAGNETTPYLLSHSRFHTTGPVFIGSESGSNPSPYNVILNMTQLQDVNSNLSANYVLGRNLVDSNHAGSGFSPIGGYVTNFSNGYQGKFNGLGHTISDLYINTTSLKEVGLFSLLGSNSTVNNLGLINPDINAAGSQRIVAGTIASYGAGTISNSYASGGSVVVNENGSANGAAGFVGVDLGSIYKSHASVAVKDNSKNAVTEIVGGFVGEMVGTSLKEVYSTGPVTVNNGYVGHLLVVGGLAGMTARGVDISDSYASSSVTVTGSGGSNSGYVGGLVGENGTNYTSTVTNAITNSYATGNVSVSGSGPIAAGGLVGKNAANSSIKNAYAMNQVTDTISGAPPAAVAFNNKGSINNVYWDTGNGSTPVVAGSATGTHGLSDAQTRVQSAYSGFDFTNKPVWVIYNGHTRPLLNAFLTPLTISASDINQVYSGQPSTLGLSNPVYSVANATNSGQIDGLSDPYHKAVNVGTYRPDLWSGQQGYRISYAGANMTIQPKALKVNIVGDPTKTLDGNTQAQLASSNYSIQGFANGQGGTVNQPYGHYSSATPGQRIPIFSDLSRGDFSFDSGTNPSNYTLPVQASGYGTIRAPAAQRSANAAAVTSSVAVAGSSSNQTTQSDGSTSSSNTSGTNVDMRDSGSSNSTRLSVKHNGLKSKQVVCSGSVDLAPTKMGSMAGLCLTP